MINRILQERGVSETGFFSICRAAFNWIILNRLNGVYRFYPLTEETVDWRSYEEKVSEFSFMGQSMAKRVLCDNNHVDTGCHVVLFSGTHLQNNLG